MDGVTLIGLFLGIIGFISAMFTIWPFFGITSPDKLLANPGTSALIVVSTFLAAIVLSYLIVKVLRFFQVEKPSPISADNIFPPPTANIDFSRLPRPSAVLVGRSKELGQLTTALNSKTKHLAHIYASGGVGKSALTFTWLQKMQPDYHGVEKVFAWSFYWQGSDDTQTSSVPFFQEALPFFGFTGELPKEEEAKGRALARCVREKSFILVLDGLEPLQQSTHIGGELKDVAIKAFLEDVQYHGLRQSTSLIVISSRQPLAELQLNKWLPERYVTIDLQTLPIADGAKLLSQLGVKGARVELEKASRDMGGHALALVLLGKLLVTEFAGKIERRDQLPPLWQGESQARRVLRWYAEQYWIRDDAESCFLDLLGLFDRPMTSQEKNLLVTQADCAKPLRALTEEDWQKLEETLEKAGLLLKPQDCQSLKDCQSSPSPRTQWDCHPLIRSYFAQQFKETRLSQYQQAHRILFEYYQSVPSKQCPDTLEELEPLYRAVVHGCLAGEYQKALNEVYWERIDRGDEGYATNKLGAYSQALTAIAAFFPHGWSHPVQQGLSEANQAWLLAEASFCLMSLGRLGEAVAPREANLRLVEKQQDWGEASRSARNLIDLSLPLGQLAKAATVARQAIQYAEQSGDLYEQVKSHAYLATTLHRQGQLDLAQQSFQRAEQLQQEWQPEYPQLYSLPGFQYCALLLDQAQSVAEFEAVLGRGEYSLN